MGYGHIVERLGKIELLGRLTTTRGILALCGEREHEVRSRVRFGRQAL